MVKWWRKRRKDVAIGLALGLVCILLIGLGVPRPWAVAAGLVGVVVVAAVVTLQERRRELDPHAPGEFVRLWRAGRLEWDDIDDYVGRWHEAHPSTPMAAIPLHVYLGLTWDEWRRWVRDGHKPPR